jgi:hypothetical protein
VERNVRLELLHPPAILALHPAKKHTNASGDIVH